MEIKNIGREIRYISNRVKSIKKSMQILKRKNKDKDKEIKLLIDITNNDCWDIIGSLNTLKRGGIIPSSYDGKIVYPKKVKINQKKRLKYIKKSKKDKIIKGGEKKMEVTEQKSEEIKRFPPEIEQKLVKKLLKIFDFDTYPIEENESIKLNEAVVLDNGYVCAFIGKTQEAKRILSKFINKDDQKTRPDISYNNEVGITSYSVEYLTSIMNVFSVFGDAVKIQMNTNSPIIIENEHFTALLAPRVER